MTSNYSLYGVQRWVNVYRIDYFKVWQETASQPLLCSHNWAMLFEWKFIQVTFRINSLTKILFTLLKTLRKILLLLYYSTNSKYHTNKILFEEFIRNVNRMMPNSAHELKFRFLNVESTRSMIFFLRATLFEGFWHFSLEEEISFIN